MVMLSEHYVFVMRVTPTRRDRPGDPLTDTSLVRDQTADQTDLPSYSRLCRALQLLPSAASQLRRHRSSAAVFVTMLAEP